MMECHYLTNDLHEQEDDFEHSHHYYGLFLAKYTVGKIRITPYIHDLTTQQQLHCNHYYHQ